MITGPDIAMPVCKVVPTQIGFVAGMPSKSITLRNGATVHFRAIRQEDEESWERLINRCTPETRHARFGYSFQHPSHEMVVRFCEFDRRHESAVVAELQSSACHELIGIARLVEVADGSAEFAILIEDRWQGFGLGVQLTRYCLDFAAKVRIRRVVATTERSNVRMLAIFRKLGFVLNEGADWTLIHAEKQIVPPPTPGPRTREAAPTEFASR